MRPNSCNGLLHIFYERILSFLSPHPSDIMPLNAIEG
jgi:hypothetical protein